MEPIQSFAQLTAHLKKLNHRKRIAVVCANDPNTEYAITRNCSRNCSVGNLYLTADIQKLITVFF